MVDDFKEIENNIDNAGSGCLWIILILISIITFVIIF
jgi:hypothetical protein